MFSLLFHGLPTYLKIVSVRRKLNPARIPINNIDLKTLLWCCAPNFSLQDGVVKLEETGRIVKGLKRELTQLQPLLESKASEAEGLLKQVRSHIIQMREVCVAMRLRACPCIFI